MMNKEGAPAPPREQTEFSLAAQQQGENTSLNQLIASANKIQTKQLTKAEKIALLVQNSPNERYGRILRRYFRGYPLATK
jgi:hypothetical protein